jgi:hypothetical protein
MSRRRQASDEPRDQPLLVAIAVGATLLMLPVLWAAGGFHLWTLLGVLLAAWMVAAGRETRPALFAMLLVGLLWLTSDPDPRTPWSMALAALMLTIHSALALRSSLPPEADIGAAIWWRWLFRAGVTLGVTGVAYLAVVAGHAVRPIDSELVLVLALGVLAGLVLVLRRETLGDASS